MVVIFMKMGNGMLCHAVMVMSPRTFYCPVVQSNEKPLSRLMSTINLWHCNLTGLRALCGMCWRPTFGTEYCFHLQVIVIKKAHNLMLCIWYSWQAVQLAQVANLPSYVLEVRVSNPGWDINCIVRRFHDFPQLQATFPTKRCQPSDKLFTESPIIRISILCDLSSLLLDKATGNCRQPLTSMQSRSQERQF
jgi:hypothetical protein